MSPSTTNVVPRPVTSELWLDVGCGVDKIPGATGIDRLAVPGVDIVHDLNLYPWPFQSDLFDHVACKHSLQHLDDFVRAIEEIHRVGKAGSIVEILGPHYASDNFNTDPTHKSSLGVRSLNYFCNNVDFKYHYYSDARFELLSSRISFRENWTDFRSSVKFNLAEVLGFESLVNRFPRIYERFFVYWVPPSEVYFRLKIIK